MPAPQTPPKPAAVQLSTPQALTVQDSLQRLNIAVDLIPRENSYRSGTPLKTRQITFHNTDNDSANDNIGEGSVALIDVFGFNPWNVANTKIVAGITPNVVAAEFRQVGVKLFKAIGGIVS